MSLSLLNTVAMVSCSAAATTAIDLEVLLREMIDLRRLAEWPAPAYRTEQFSSYDRSSAEPGGPGWFANSDGFGGEKIPNFVAVLEPPADEQSPGRYLICDVPGPGVLLRTWTAGMAGTLRVELDDQSEQLYEGPAADFLANPYACLAERAGLEPAVLADTFVQAQSAYCPIPFAQRLRITWTGRVRDVHFYHVNVRRYTAPATVRTFTVDALRAAAPTLRAVAGVLADPDGRYAYASTRAPEEIAVELAPGAAADVLKLAGPVALERLTLRLTAANRDFALRQTLLHVICDDYPRGQVQAPLGDFFGAAPGVNPMNTLPMSVCPDGTMTCRFVMPCRQSLRIRLENRGQQTVKVSGTALPMDYAWDDERSLHFRARWRVDHNVLGQGAEPQDMPYLMAFGRGRYVGTALMLWNPTRIPTPYGSWWGEGDEKIFVDGDTFPSTFGTGSEDYFNYAWSSPDIFIYPYCAQPRNDGPGNRGYVTNLRWHLLDDLPFEQRLAFYMELYCHDRTPDMSYARIAYHYARPGLMDDHVLITDEDLRPPQYPPSWEPLAKFAVRNATFLAAEDVVMGEAARWIESGPLWAGGQLLVWRPIGPGDELRFVLPTPDEAHYGPFVCLRLDARGGRVSARFAGTPLRFEQGGETISLFDPHRVLARQYDGQELQLPGGTHEFVLRYEGPVDGGAGTPAIGIDYLGLRRRPLQPNP